MNDAGDRQRKRGRPPGSKNKKKNTAAGDDVESLGDAGDLDVENGSGSEDGRGPRKSVRMQDDSSYEKAERELYPRTQKGMGPQRAGAGFTVNAQYIPMNRLIMDMPWNQQPAAYQFRRSAHGAHLNWIPPFRAFGLEKYLRNQRAMRGVLRWYAPAKTASAVRVLDSEETAPTTIDKKGIALSALSRTNELRMFLTTELRLTNVQICTSPPSRSVNRLLHNGPTGGLQMMTPIVLWTMDLNPENPGIFSPMLNRLATVLSMSLGPSDVTSAMYAVSTNFTEVTAPKNHMGKGGMRMTNEGSLIAQASKYPRNASEDVHPDLLANIINYRDRNADPDDITIIPRSCQDNDPTIPFEDRNLDDDDMEHEPVSVKKLFNLKKWQASYPVKNSEEMIEHIQVTALRIEGHLGVCPLTALQELCKADNVGTDLSEPLCWVITHMLHIMGLDHDASDIEKMFDVGYEHNIAKYCSEADMFEAINWMAFNNKLSPPSVGGRRMDVTNKEEMAAWREYKHHITDSIQKNWNLVRNRAHTWTSSSNRAKGVQRPEENFGPDIRYTGILPMGMSVAEFDGILEKEVMRNGIFAQEHRLCDAPSNMDLHDVTSEWFKGMMDGLRRENGFYDQDLGVEFPRMYRVDDMVFVFIDGCFLYNHGIIWEVKITGSYTRKGQYRNKDQTSAGNVEDNLLPAPMDISHMFKLYADDTLNLDCAFDPNTPIVLCFKWMKENRNDMPPSLIKLLEKMEESDNALGNVHETRKRRSTRAMQIDFVTGQQEHPIYDMANTFDRHGPLRRSARNGHESLISMLRDTMGLVSRSCVTQFAMVARALLIMKRTPDKTTMVDYHSNLNRFLHHLHDVSKMNVIHGKRIGAIGNTLKNKNYSGVRDGRDSIELMDMQQFSHKFDQWSINGLDVRASFANLLVMQVLQSNHVMTFYGCKHESCGNITFISDFAGTCEVHNIEFNGKTKPERYTAKSSGCGADWICGLLAQLQMVFGKYLLKGDIEVVQFFNSKKAADKLMNKLSDSRVHCVLGCGVLGGPNGEYKLEDLSIEDIGLIAYLLEFGKEKAGDACDNVVKLIEISGGQPSAFFNNLHSITWDTAEGMLRVQIIKTNSSSAFCAIASNLSKQIVPRSMHDGGRATFIPSPVSDQAAVITIVHDAKSWRARHEQVNSQVARVIPSTRTNDDGDEEGMGFSAIVGNEDEELREDVEDLGFDWLKKANFSNGKIVTSEQAHMNCIYFLKMWFFRKAIPYAGKTMTLHYRDRCDTFKTSLDELRTSMSEHFKGSFRFGTDDKIIFRKFSSIVRTNFAVAEHLHDMIMRCMLVASRMPQMKADGTPYVNMYQVFTNIVMSILHTPPSLTTYLNSIYLWLSMDALDMHIPVMSTVCLYTMNIQTSPPLHVLALAARNETLTEEQELLFWYIADKFCRPCCDRRDKKANENKLMTVGDLKPMGNDPDYHKILNSIFEERAELNHSELQKMQERRSKSEMSPYICARMKEDYAMKVDTMPDWVIQPNSQSKGERGLRWDQIKFKLLAKTQEVASIEARRHPNQPPEHDTGIIWNAIHEGFRLPIKPTHATDGAMKSFLTPHETAAFYETILFESSKQPCGIRRTFLKMCGLSEKNSTNEVMTTIFKRWLNKHNQKFPMSDAWKKPIIDEDKIPSKFAIGVSLVPKDKDNGKEKGKLKSNEAIKFALQIDLGFHVVDALINAALLKTECKVPLQPKPGSPIPVIDPEKQITQVYNQRIMQQMTLQVMTMMIHTQVPMHNLPVVNAVGDSTQYGKRAGKAIMLRGPSPYASNFKTLNGPELVFDPRLHLDKGEILSTHCRTTSAMHIVNNNQPIMVYRQVIHRDEPKIIEQNHDAPLFPPESTAHMLCWVRVFQNITRKFHHENPDLGGGECWLPYALADFLESMNISENYRGVEDMLSKYHITPTYCMTQKEMEMLFITSRYNWIFAIVVNDDGTFTVKPAKMTNNFSDMKFDGLPLKANDRVDYMPYDFASFLLGGFKRLRNGDVICRHPYEITGDMGHGQKKPPECDDGNVAEVLGAVPLPVMPFPAFCKINPTYPCVEATLMTDDNERRNMTVFDTATLFHLQVERYSSEEQTRRWIKNNPDIPPPVGDFTLHVIYRSNVQSEFGRYWHRIDRSDCDGWDEIIQPEVFGFPLECINRDSEEELSDMQTFELNNETWKAIVNNETDFLRALHRQCFVEFGDICIAPDLRPDPRYSFWVTDGQELFYIRTREELKYRLNRSDCFDSRMWVRRDSIINPDQLLRADNPELYKNFHIMRDPCTDVDYVDDYKYDDEEFQLAWNNRLTLMNRKKEKQALLDSCMKSNTGRSQPSSALSSAFPNAASSPVATTNENIEKIQTKLNYLDEQIAERNDKMANATVKRTLLARWKVGWDTLSWDVMPSLRHQGDNYALGQFIRFDGNSEYTMNRFIRDGQYMVSFMHEGQFWTRRIDAVSAMMATLQEGRPVWICLTPTRYQNLISATGAYLENDLDHKEVWEGGRALFLRGFYVVSDDEPERPLDASMMVLIQIHEKTSIDHDFEYDDANCKHKALVHVKVYGDLSRDDLVANENHTDCRLVAMIHVEDPLVEEDQPPSIVFDNRPCGVVNYLVRDTYKPHGCPHDSFTPLQASVNEIYPRKVPRS